MLADWEGLVNIELDQPLDGWRPRGMKTSNAKSHFNFLRHINPRLACSLVVTTLFWGATVRAEEGEAKPPVAGPPGGTTDQQANQHSHLIAR